MTGPHSNDSIPHADGPDAVRDPHGEPLSAMMDGTLSDDESRFLLRRMQHDAELAGRWERWQFYGDAMRGCAGRALPADFNRRVALAIAADEADAEADRALSNAAAGDPSGRTLAPARVAAARRPLLRWGGGAALAASVALVAVVGLRPGGFVGSGTAVSALDAALVDAAPSGPAASGPAPERLQADAATEVSAVAAAAGQDTAGTAGTADAMPSASTAPTGSPARSPALATAPLRGAEPGAPRPPSSERRAIASSPTQPSAAQASPLVLAAQPADSGSAARVPDFGIGSDADEAPLIAKPWPRSPLLQGRIDGGVMVDYGQGDGRGLILGRPVQAPQSGSPLLSPPRSDPPSSGPDAGAPDAVSPAAAAAAAAAGTGSGRTDDPPR